MLVVLTTNFLEIGNNMEPKKSAVDQFFDDLPKEEKIVSQDIFNEKTEIPAKDKEEEIPDSIKNRRHRRLEAQVQEEREKRIALEARLQAQSEFEKFKSDTTIDEDTKDLLTLYGNDDKGKQAAEITKALLQRVAQRTKTETLDELEERQINQASERRQYESYIDEQLEAIEDNFNVDVTSNAPNARKARREFLELVETLSPKDKDGTIIDYADFTGTWKMYQSKNSSNEDNERRSDIASKSMAKSSGTVNSDKTNDDAQRSYLRSIGLNV